MTKFNRGQKCSVYIFAHTYMGMSNPFQQKSKHSKWKTKLPLKDRCFFNPNDGFILSVNPPLQYQEDNTAAQ